MNNAVNKELIVSDRDYLLDKYKKYFHIKVLMETKKHLKIQYVDSGRIRTMTHKQFNDEYKIDEVLDERQSSKKVEICLNKDSEG